MGEERRLRSKWTERKERYERLQRLQYAREQHAVRLRERQLRLDREANDSRLLSEASAGKSGGRLDDAGSRRQISQLRLHMHPRLISPSRTQERLIRARRRARRLNRSAYSTPGASDVRTKGERYFQHGGRTRRDKPGNWTTLSGA